MRLTSVVGVIVVVAMSGCAEMIPTSPSLSSARPALSETRAVVALPSAPEPLPAVGVTPAPEPPPALVVTPEPEPPPPAVVVAPEPSVPPVEPDPIEPAAPTPVDPTLIVCPAGTIATLGAAGIYCALPTERFTCPTGTHPEMGATPSCVAN